LATALDVATGPFRKAKPLRAVPPRNTRALTEDIYGEPKPRKGDRSLCVSTRHLQSAIRIILWCHSPRNIRAASTRQRRLSNHLGRYSLLSSRISKRGPRIRIRIQTGTLATNNSRKDATAK